MVFPRRGYIGFIPRAGGACRARQQKLAHQVGQIVGLDAQALGSGRGLLDQRGILLRHVVQLRQGGVDGGQVFVLRFAAGFEIGHGLRGLMDGTYHLLHGLPGIACQA